MKIAKENNELVVRIPLTQKINNSYMNEKDLYDTDNLIGVIANNDFTISHLIDLNYKDSQQEGMPILHLDTREELEKVCKDFNITIWEHPICDYCQKVIRGTHTIGEKGNMCLNCSYKEKNPQVCTECGKRFNNSLASMCGKCFEEA